MRSVKISDIILVLVAGLGCSVLVYGQILVMWFIQRLVTYTPIDGVYFYNSGLYKIEILLPLVNGCIIFIFISLIMWSYFVKRNVKLEIAILFNCLAYLEILLLLLIFDWKFGFITKPTSEYIMYNYSWTVTHLTAFIIAPVCILLLILCTYLYARYTTGKRISFNKKKMMTYTFLIAIMIIVVPQIIIVAGAESGAIKGLPAYYYINLNIERIANDTIVITNNGDDALAPTLWGIRHTSWSDLTKILDPDRPFIILIHPNATADGWCNASNSLEIERESLNLDITPISGLGLEQGGKVSYTGPVINDSNHTMIMIFLNYRDIDFDINKMIWEGMYSPCLQTIV